MVHWTFIFKFFCFSQNNNYIVTQFTLSQSAHRKKFGRTKYSLNHSPLIEQRSQEDLIISYEIIIRIEIRIWIFISMDFQLSRLESFLYLKWKFWVNQQLEFIPKNIARDQMVFYNPRIVNEFMRFHFSPKMSLSFTINYPLM